MNDVVERGMISDRPRLNKELASMPMPTIAKLWLRHAVALTSFSSSSLNAEKLILETVDEISTCPVVSKRKQDEEGNNACVQQCP